MRLCKIKLAGFKTFVDPTTLYFPSNLVGIVGPNGCGKSNVIDAVRWVMGESSAKSLRGDSMADVIFNGSAARKPVSHASIELVFDNSGGVLQGQYAAYSEISLKRHVTRDGQSNYFLNGARCRRRDITDIFLGTGLGPNSYAIIEQNMISRLIEARPEELRTLLEEAAGISKYKERRRETETRMRHTRENLERLSDVREELGKQLERLQRQAAMAEKYKVLKQQERRVKSEWLALRWRELATRSGAREQSIEEQKTALEARIASQRAIEAALEKCRNDQTEASAAFTTVQGQFYSVGAEIGRLEQTITHIEEQRRRQQDDLTQVEHARSEADAHLAADRQQIALQHSELSQAESDAHGASLAEQNAQVVLMQAEQAMQTWQGEWDNFNLSAPQPTQRAEVERATRQQRDQQLIKLQERLLMLEQEQTALSPAVLEQDILELEERRAEQERQALALQEELQTLMWSIDETRELNRQLAVDCDARHSDLNEKRACLSSLRALQEAALGQSHAPIVSWLTERGLQNAQRLAQSLTVEPGWERAVECALGFHLEAVCVDDVTALLPALPRASLTLIDSSGDAQAQPEQRSAARLIDQVQSSWPLDGLLGAIHTAATLEEALALRPRLSTRESVITPDGIWLGRGWLRVNHSDDKKAGVLRRVQEIKELAHGLSDLTNQLDAAQQGLETRRAELRECEARRESCQAALTKAQLALGATASQLHTQESRLEHMRGRHVRVSVELDELHRDSEQVRTELAASQERLRLALGEAETLSKQRQELVRLRDEHCITLEHARQGSRATQELVHRIALRVELARGARLAAEQRLQRMENQLALWTTRRAELTQQLEESRPVLETHCARLEVLLMERLTVETGLGQTRAAMEDIDTRLRRLEQQRHGAEQEVQDVRAGLEQLRLAGLELKVQGHALSEQIVDSGFKVETLLESLSDDATEADWQAQSEQLAQKIQRLGAVNLAAIDELAEQTERKSYLDAQFNDLNEALSTLEGAIRKIDQETRARFKDTLDKINASLQTMFPRLFDGGQAYLELTGDSLLESGVTIMARPPGKRNSTIHLLSGGEKALTAVAMVFAIFELNPAPFCMLDEVDASLDDANVGRFCELVKEMSERIQFIYITHNKNSMDMAHQLTGVTMHEAGVSRLVTVDLDAAAMIAV